ncbi:MAG: S8 family serine peptidase, partial [Bdellovibrionales bacterium]|nr:S8 family serine peptidase [Bdellovibrionales bacterium]
KAQQEGAFIHSNSWGAPNSNGRYDNFTVQADTYVFNNMDFLPVFAAGNDGVDGNKDGVIDEGSLSSPGSAKNVLTVGASKNYLLQGGIQRKLADLRGGKEKWGVEPLGSSLLSEDGRGMAMFSSRGPAADGRIKPEVVAPGTNIVSARNTHPKADPKASWGVFNDHYLFMGGTSMSTPLVSGAMTVIRGYLQQKLGAVPSAALLKAAVSNTAFDLFPGQFGARAQGQEQPVARPNNHQGWGRVALDRMIGVESILYFDERAGLRTGEAKSFVVNTKGGAPLAVTLAWSDAPGTASAQKALVNDLDLTVTAPNGEVIQAFGKTTKDSTNNMEQIDISAPQAGVYKVEVKAASVPQGKSGAQPFALVISGVAN